MNGPYNYTADGNVGNWPKVIAEAQKLDVEHVLPGHGPAGGKEVLANQAAFFTELKRAVEDAVRSGKKLDEIVTMTDGQPKSTTIQLSEKVHRYVGEPFAAQVKDTYDEITSGKPAGDLPH